MSDNTDPQVNKLLKEGITAARSGDREKARELLQQVVELDQYNEQGWLWLASVVDTDEERRTCLGNVVVINPNNTKAQQLLDQIERRAAGFIVNDSSPIPGVNRRQSLLMIAIGVALLIVICVIVLLNFVGGDDSEESAGAAVTNTPAPTEPGQEETTIAILSLTPPTPTRTPRPTLPPAASPTPLPASPTPYPALPPPPASAGGRILMLSGNVFGNDQYQPVFMVPANNPRNRQPATQDELRGNSPSFAPDGIRYTYAQFNPGNREVTLMVLNANGTNPNELSDFWFRSPIILDPAMPAWSPDAFNSRVAFIGRTTSANQNDIFVVPVPNNVPEPPIPPTDEFGNPVEVEYPSPLIQLTNDTIEETWPAWSPDGSRILFVADTTEAGITAVDLRIIDVETQVVQYLTTDRMDVVESAPDWGGDNNRWIIYSGSVAGSTESDIWIVAVDQAVNDYPELQPTAVPTPEDEEVEPNLDGPRVLFDLGPHDIQPRWSPDGRYIVFSSDRNGEFDVYVYELETGEFYAITNNQDNIDIANDWTIP